GLLSRPSLDAIRAYRAHVDAAMDTLLARTEPSSRLGALIELGLNHEQQHQELILTDVKHLLSRNPLKPAYALAQTADAASGAPPLEWVEFREGLVEIGHDGSGFAFDNETPRHRRYLEAFALASRPVTNAEYAAFIADGGYRRPELWLSEGWDWVNANGIAAPLYWEDSSGGARHRRIQRQVHVQSVCVTRRFLRDPAYAHPRDLPELLSGDRALAVQRLQARPRLVTIRASQWRRRSHTLFIALLTATVSFAA